MYLFGKISLSIIIKYIFKATKLNKLKYIALSPNLVLCELRKSINNFNQFPEKKIIAKITKIGNLSHIYKITNIYVENPFSLKLKTIGQTLNKSTIIKSITLSLLKFIQNLRSTLNTIIYYL